MSLMIESMESRVMLTASAGVIVSDLASGAAALATAKANLKAAVKEAALDVKMLKADTKGVKLTATQKSALTTLSKAEAIDAAKVSSTITKTLASGKLRGAQLEAELKALKAHPTSIAIQAKVATALAKLQGVFSATVISNVQSQVSAAVITLDADLTSVATAIPSTQSTVSATQSDLANDQVAFSVDTAAIQNAITALAADLA